MLRMTSSDVTVTRIIIIIIIISSSSSSSSSSSVSATDTPTTTSHHIFIGWDRLRKVCVVQRRDGSIRDFKQVAQLSQRDRAAAWVSLAQISMLFYVFKEHCCRLLLQLVSPVNRQRLKCYRMQRRRANGWFSSRTKFVFKGMSPTNYLCTDR